MDPTKPAIFALIALGGALVVALLANAYLPGPMSILLGFGAGRSAIFIGFLSIGFAISAYTTLYILSFKPMRLVATLVFLLFLVMSYTMTAAYIGVPFNLVKVELSEDLLVAGFGPPQRYDPFLAQGIIVTGTISILVMVLFLSVIHLVELRHSSNVSRS